MANPKQLDNSFDGEEVPASMTLAVLDLGQICAREHLAVQELLVIKGRRDELNKLTKSVNTLVDIFLIETVQSKVTFYD